MRSLAPCQPRAGPLALAAMLFMLASMTANASTNVAPDHATVAINVMVKPAEIIIRPSATNAVALTLWRGVSNSACGALVSGANANQATVGGTNDDEPAFANSTTIGWMWWQNANAGQLSNAVAYIMRPNTAGWQMATPQNGGQGRSAGTRAEGFTAPRQAVAIFFGRQVPVGQQETALIM